jgi:hypothetical protein
VNKAVGTRKSVIAGSFIAKITPVIGSESPPDQQASV